MSEGKISFSFGAKPAKAAPAGPSNLELLMAKAKAPASDSKPKPSSKPGKGSKPAAPVAALFNDDDAPARRDPKTNDKKPRPPVNLLSRAERKAQEAALQVDPSVFDYDGAYEAMKRSEAAVEAAKQAEDAERKPKYIEAFLQAARTRKLDELAAKEKMLEREREAEGDEFADKEAFVTEAYKKQMEEVRVAREEEKKREEAMRNSSKGPGLTSLYKTMLDANEAKHAAAVASASAPSGPSLAIRPPTFDDEEEYDPLLAREAAASGSNPAPVAGSTSISSEGRAIEINDDGEVVNKRSLFKAGLNIVKKPKPETPSLLANSTRTRAADDKPYVSRAVGAAAGYHERMARERARLADQLREQEEKKRADAERRRQEEEEAARRRREGDDGEAERKRQEAKERFLARKRAREEAEAEARKKPKE